MYNTVETIKKYIPVESKNRCIYIDSLSIESIELEDDKIENNFKLVLVTVSGYEHLFIFKTKKGRDKLFLEIKNKFNME